MSGTSVTDGVEPGGQQSTIINTGDGVLTGVTPGATPEQLRRQSAFNADNPQGQQPQGQQNRTFTSEDIERARQQEKEKLYGQLEEVRTELNTIRAEREAAQRAAEEARQAAEAEARRREEEEMDLRALLTKRDEEYNQRFAEVEEERRRAEALLMKEREVGQLNEYRQQRLSQEAENIIPELLDYVSGNSAEEIEAAIEAAKQRSASIVAGVRQFQQQQVQGMRGVSSTAPPMGPMETQQEQRPLSAAEIAAMSPAEYMKHRGQLLQASSQQFYGRR